VVSAPTQDHTEAWFGISDESDSSDSGSVLLQPKSKAAFAPEKVVIRDTIAFDCKEYTDITFEDAVKAIMPAFRPRLPSDESFDLSEKSSFLSSCTASDSRTLIVRPPFSHPEL
jgi:hypothetical protein